MAALAALCTSSGTASATRARTSTACSALIRPIFQAGSGDEAHSRVGEAVAELEGRLPKIACLLEEAEDGILVFYALPTEHWSKLRSTNPLEALQPRNRRRTDVVGIFPDDASLIRLASMLAIEANDESLVGRCYMSRQSMDPLCARGPRPPSRTRSTSRRSPSSSRLSSQCVRPTRASASYTTPGTTVGSSGGCSA